MPDSPPPEGALAPEHFAIKTLGRCEVRSPLRVPGGTDGFVDDGVRVPLHVELRKDEVRNDALGFEKAGPRELIYFDPKMVRAAIITCGGLCPGINNVIRSIVLQLHYGYGVERVLGIRYGYAGFLPGGEPPLELTPRRVSDIHRDGGTVLGTSRTQLDPDVAVDYLAARDINVLFTIGGEGTQTAAHLLYEAASRRGYRLSLVGIPKTIDNDVQFVWRSFGYFTAIERAREVISTAHNEATSHSRGVGLVKLMGRDAGFVTAGATLASQDVNFAIIPEIPCELEGDRGFLRALRLRLERPDSHAVIVVAEGVGRNDGLVENGRPARTEDIGIFLRDRIKRSVPSVDVKYFDPAYYIRSVPANSDDALFCDQLARCAVHAAMAGRTNVLIGYWYNLCTHVPIELATGSKKRISEENEIWRSVLQTTGQPSFVP